MGMLKSSLLYYVSGLGGPICWVRPGCGFWEGAEGGGAGFGSPHFSAPCYSMASQCCDLGSEMEGSFQGHDIQATEEDVAELVKL